MESEVVPNGGYTCEEETFTGTSPPESATCYKETNVGMTEFLGHHKGFKGIIKHRICDFIVNEVDTSGNVVHLTSTNAVDPESRDQKDARERGLDYQFTDEQKAKLLKVSGNDSVEFPAPESKEARTVFHEALKVQFPDLISSTTGSQGDCDRKILVRRKSPKDERWPQGVADCCLFTLYKENIDTLEAVRLMSNKLGVKPKCFAFAGTKDKRGCTSQLMTAYRIRPSKLVRINGMCKCLVVGNFTMVNEQLKLGDLTGNRFQVVLRDVSGSSEDVLTACDSLEQTGFINYFGLQRFGTRSISTYEIGRSLLKNDWKQAVELILRKPSCPEPTDLSDCRNIWQSTHDARQAYKRIKHKNCIERSILHSLTKTSGKDYLSALNSIPRSTRTMFLHSYQSLIWNKVLSKRLAQHGLVVLPGDLVLRKNSNSEHKEADVIEDPQAHSIEEIVIPLVGHAVTLPKNSMADWIQDFLAEDQLTIENFRQKNREYSLPGAYRKIVVKPTDFTFEITNYADDTKPLVRTDKDNMLNTTNTCSSNSPCLTPISEATNSVTTDPFKAVILSFTLPSSAYATMLIRELTRIDTNPDIQSTQIHSTSTCSSKNQKVVFDEDACA